MFKKLILITKIKTTIKQKLQDMMLLVLHTYGIVTHTWISIENVKIIFTSTHNDTVVVKAGEVHFNVYKISAVSQPTYVLSTYPHPSVYSDNLNSHHRNCSIQLIIRTVRYLWTGLKNMVCISFSTLKTQAPSDQQHRLVSPTLI